MIASHVLILGLCFVSSISGATLVRQFQHDSSMKRLEVYGGDVFGTGHTSTLNRWKISTGELLNSYTHFDESRSFVVGDGKIFSTGQGGPPSRVNIETGAVEKQYGSASGFPGIAYHDGVLFLAGVDAQIIYFDSESETQLGSFSIPGYHQVPMINYGRHIFVLGDNAVVEYDSVTHKEVAQYSGLSSAAQPYATEGRLAVSFRDGTVGVWDMNTKEIITSFSAVTDRFTPSGRPALFGSQLFLADENGGSDSIFKFNWQTGQLIDSWVAHNGRVHDVRFYGRYLLSCSKDATIKMWDVVDCEGGEWDSSGINCIVPESNNDNSQSEASSASNNAVLILIVSVVVGFLCLLVAVVLVSRYFGTTRAMQVLGKTSFDYSDNTRNTLPIAAGSDTSVYSPTDTGVNKASKSVFATAYSATGNTTYVAEDQGLFLPGYLMLTKDDYKKTEKIAYGGTSDIYLGVGLSKELKKYGMVIVKFLHEVISEPALRQEVAMMASFVGCRNIVQLLGFDIESRVILMKLCKYGNLDNWCRGKEFRRFHTLRTHFSFVLDIARGLSEIHRRQLVHSDLKTPNVLVDAEVSKGKEIFYCVITDLGASQIYKAQFENKVEAFKPVVINAISTRFAAPEVIVQYRAKKKVKHEPEIDMYAFGAVLYEVITRVAPWKAKYST